jgi:hypothetical protein
MSGVKIATVANAIEALSISGVTVKDIDNIPTSATVRDCFLIPKPDAFVTGFSLTPQSQGTTAQGAKADVKYTLSYLLIVGAVGSGRNATLDFYSGIFSKAVLVINAVRDITAPLTGSVEITPAGISNLITVTDPAGVQHPGLELAFEVLEFYEV